MRTFRKRGSNYSMHSSSTDSDDRGTDMDSLSRGNSGLQLSRWGSKKDALPDAKRRNRESASLTVAPRLGARAPHQKEVKEVQIESQGKIRIAPHDGTAASIIVLETRGDGFFVEKISGSFERGDVDTSETLASSLVSKLVTRGYVITAQSVLPPKTDGTKELLFTLTRNAVSGTVSCGSKGASAQGVVLACQTANGGTEHGNGTDKLSASPKQSSRRTRRHMNVPLSKEVLIIPESKEAATSTAAEKVTVLTTVRTWMAVREQGDAERAAELSTEDIVVRTPLGAVRGLENVKDQVYTTAASATTSATELNALRVSTGVWTVRREHKVKKETTGAEFTLRQEWLVLSPTGKSGTPLIAEVCTSLA